MELTEEQQREFNRTLVKTLRSDPIARKNAEIYLGETITEEALDKYLETHAPEPNPILTELLENVKHRNDEK